MKISKKVARSIMTGSLLFSLGGLGSTIYNLYKFNDTLEDPVQIRFDHIIDERLQLEDQILTDCVHERGTILGTDLAVSCIENIDTYFLLLSEMKSLEGSQAYSSLMEERESYIGYVQKGMYFALAMLLLFGVGTHIARNRSYEELLLKSSNKENQ